MDGVAYLITKSHSQDAIGQFIEKENSNEIFVKINNIGRNEWVAAGRNGLTPEIMLETAAVNYTGETEAEFQGTRYSIYRTYQGPNSDSVELYLERKAGVQNGSSQD